MDPIERLDRVLNRQLCTVPDADVRRWWEIKIRAKRLLAQTTRPEALAVRILHALRLEDTQRLPRAA